MCLLRFSLVRCVSLRHFLADGRAIEGNLKLYQATPSPPPPPPPPTHTHTHTEIKQPQQKQQQQQKQTDKQTNKKEHGRLNRVNVFFIKEL